MRETYCYEELFRTTLKAGQELKLDTGIRYSDIKKYATVQILYRCASNNGVRNICFKLGGILLSRFQDSGHVLILDNRNKDMVQLKAWSGNSSLLQMIEKPIHNDYAYAYEHFTKPTLREIEKISIDDTANISLSWRSPDDSTCKVDTEIIITGLTKYV